MVRPSNSSEAEADDLKTARTASQSEAGAVGRKGARTASQAGAAAVGRKGARTASSSGAAAVGRKGARTASQSGAAAVGRKGARTASPSGAAGRKRPGPPTRRIPGALATLLSALVFAATLSCSTGPGFIARAQLADALERSLDLVKSDFEQEATGSRDPRVIQAASWKAVGLAFLEALAAVDTDRWGEFRDRNTEELDAMWADPKSGWDQREIRAMRLCDDVWSRLAAVTVARNGDSDSLRELEGVMTRHEVAAARARTEPAKRAEARVFWSNRMAVVFPFLAAGVVPDSAGALGDMAEDLVNYAEIVADRRDVHYQARMELLYNNNVRSLAGMMFLALTQPGSPYLGDATALRQSWDDSMANPSYKVSDKITHSLLAAAQLSFPLAHWIGSANM
ncbi:MAG: hypothetical protein LBR80_06675 [Deltaproteobacteria bacterium]|jgi:hypothetical protein|nr:hypothetical protein [Deltaproteobacteria bacterium]